MTWPQLVGLCIGTAAILGASYAIGRLLRDLARGMRRLSRMLDDWLGEPEHPGLPGSGRPGVLARLATIEEGQRATRGEVAEQGRRLAVLSQRVVRIEKELHPHADGGSTFRDKVDEAMDRPKVEAGGVTFQAERAYEPEAESVRLTYGFTRQRSR